MTIVNKLLHRFDETTALFLEYLPRKGVGRFSLETADSTMLTPLCQEAPLEDLQNINLISAVFRQLEHKHDIELQPKLKDEIRETLIQEINKLEAAITKSIEEDSEEKKDKDELDLTVLKEEEPSILYFKVANYIMNYTKFITFRDNEDCYHYDEGIYKDNGEVIIKEKVRELLGDITTTHIVNEIINSIKDNTHIDRNTANTDLSLLCVENGILNIFTSELSEYTPDLIFFSKLPVLYDPKAVCSLIMKFLKEVLYEDDIKVIEEAIGYTIYRKHSFHKAFMLVGGGRNGKGTLLRLIQALLGKGNYSPVPLQEISRRFKAAELYQKMANICGDLSPKALRYTDYFTMLTGEDTIHAEKKHKDPFDFVSYAKQWYSTNRPPEVTDDTLAFWSRWIYFKFPNVFLGPADDKQLDEKLQTPEELSGLLNLALEGLKRLLEQKDFSYGRSTTEVQEEWIRESDSVGAFVLDMIEYDPDSEVIKKRDLYDDYYLPYCNEMEYPTDSIIGYEDFGKKMKIHCRGHIKHTHPRDGDKRFTAWKGIKIKDGTKKPAKVKKDDKIKDKKQKKLPIEVKEPVDDKIQKEIKLEGLVKDIWDFIGEEGGVKEFVITGLKKRKYDVLGIERTLKTMIERGLVKLDKDTNYLTRSKRWQ